LRGRLQSSHEVARQRLLSGKIKSKEYYDKDYETVEVRTGQKVLLLDEIVQRGRSKKLSPQYIGPYEVLEVGVNVVIKRGRSAQNVHINMIRPFY
jgi:hypoxanthine phosphoribosyltransferase